MCHYLRFAFGLLFCLMFLTGCGTNDVSAPGKTNLNLRIAVMGVTDQELEDNIAIANNIRQFMKYSKVKIDTYKYYPAASQRYIDAILKDLASEDRPDIIFVSSVALAQGLDDAGALMALDKVVKNDIPEFETLLYKSAVLGVRWQGNIIGIPSTLDPVMVIYNQTHFQEARVQPISNWSWNEFAETSARILSASNKTKKSSLFGSGYMGAGVLNRSPYCWLPFIYSNGGGYIEALDINIQSSNSVYALNWLQSQLVKGDLVDVTNLQGAFLSKRVSFGLDKLSNINLFNKKENIYRALPVPKSPMTGHSITVVGGSMYVVNAQSKNIDLAVDFLKASISSEAQKYITSKTNQLPVRKDVQFPNLPWMPDREILASVLENARPVPQPMIGDRSVWVLNWDSLASGKSTAEETANAAAKELSTVVALKETPATPKPVEAFLTQSSLPQQEPPADDFKGVMVRWVTHVFRENTKIQLVNAFNKTHKNIYISITPYDDFNDDKIDQHSLFNGSADIVDLPVDMSEIGSYVDTNKIIPLDRYLQSEIPYMQSGFAYTIKYKGKTYALPIKRDPLIIYADHNIWKQVGTPFPKNGWRWEDFQTWVNKTIAVNAPKHSVSFPSLWDKVYQQKGGQWSEISPELLKSTLSMLSQLHHSSPADSSPITIAPSILDVSQGKVAAYIGYSSQVYLLKQNSNDSLDKAGIVALPLPTFATQQKGTGIIADYIVLSAKAPHLDEAAQFIRWLVSKEASQAYAKSTRDTFPAVMYTDVYALYRNYWGSQVNTLFPLQFQATSIPPTIARASDEIVVKYLKGELSLVGAVDALTSYINANLK